MPAERRIDRSYIPTRFVIAGAATLLASLQLVGRWDFSRLVGSAPTPLAEPRLWIAVALIFLTIVREYHLSRADLRSNVVNASSFVPMVLLSLFVAYMVSTAFWSDDPGLALPKVYDYLFLLTVAWLFFLWNYDPETSVWFWAVILVLGMVLAIVALLGLSPGASPNPDRLSTLGGGPNVFGRIMGLVSLFCIYLAIRGRKAYHIVFWALLASFMFLMIVLTGSRGALVATVCGAVVLVAIEVGRGKVTRKQLLKLCTVGAVVLVLALVSPAGPRIIRFFGHRVIELTLLQGYTARRDVVYINSLQVIQENPVFGIGLESFYARKLGRYPHNLILEVLVEGGFVGGLLFLAVGFAFVLTLWNHRHRIDSCSVAALVQAFIAAQFSGDIYDNRGVLVFVLLALNPGLRIYADRLLQGSARKARVFLRRQLASNSCHASGSRPDM